MSQSISLLNMNPVAAYEAYMVPGIMIPGTQLLLEYALPQPGERVLDVACGTGIVARNIAPIIGKTGSLTAIDLNPKMIEYARTLPDAAGINWQEGNVQALPLPDQSFDLVVSNQGLQFFPDKVAALREIRRVLVPGGRVVVNVQQSLQQNALYAKFNNVLLTHMGIPALAAPFTFGEAEPLYAVLSEVGFTAVEVIPVSHLIRFPSIDVFIQASVIGSAAVIPVLAKLDQTARQQLIDQISQDMTDTLSEYLTDGQLVMPLAAHIGRGVV